MSPSSRKAVGAAVVAAVLVAIAMGLWIIGSPADARRARLDARRVEHLQEISTSVDVYWTRRKELPPSLDVLSPEVGMMTLPSDPGTAEPYSYRVIGGNAYELCATFERESQPGRVSGSDAFWTHGAGRYCYQLTAKEIKR